MARKGHKLAVFSKERLILLRTQFKLTQDELSTKISVSKKQVSAWETGQYEPRTDSLIQLARFFGVSTDYLLNLVDAPDERLHERELTPMQRKLLAAFDRGDVETILSIARQLLKKHRNNRR